MARFKDREKAIKLRKQEKSYSQIKKILKVSKSTLSIWLRNYPLSKKRIRELRDWNEQRIENYRTTMRRKRQERLDKIYKEQRRILLPLNKREFSIAGLMLYWGEGTKSRSDSLTITNSDPAIIKFFIHWLNKILSVPKNKIKVYLHLYKDMVIDKEIKYWSKIIKIPVNQFSKPYIKKTSSKRINHKGGFGHGTCAIRINNVSLAERVFMGIKAISDYYDKFFNART